MAHSDKKGINSYMTNESVAPYVGATVADTNDQPQSRGIYVKVGGDYTLTINGEDIAFAGLLIGTIYPLSITKSSSVNVILLY